MRIHTTDSDETGPDSIAEGLRIRIGDTIMKGKIAAFLLIAALLITPLSACKGGADNTESEKKAASSGSVTSGDAAKPKTMSLPITEHDSLNPYLAKSKNNQELGLLLYDSLVTVDDGFVPQPGLAEQIEENGKVWTIRLKTAKFSDGSNVTAEDVTYSLTAAQKATGTRFAAQLENIATKNAAGPSVLTITLKKPDPNFKNLLDFPIFKLNSDHRKDEDNKDLPPIGSGRYLYEESQEGLFLKANPDFRGGAPAISQIKLISTPDSVSLEHQIASGNISVVYSDLSDGKFPVMNGTATKAPLNHLVFLGVNSKSGPLTDPLLRSAVSLSVNRSGIADQAYQTYALPAAGVFSPLWAAGSPSEISLPATANLNLAVEELAKAGYNKKDSEGYVLRSGQRLTLKLLVNKENSQRLAAAKQIQESLKKAGIAVNLSQLSFSAYSEAVGQGSFDLFLGEMRFLNNMDLSPLILTGEPARYFPEESVTAARYQAYQNGEDPLSEFVDALNEELPVIPLCYRCGILISLPVFRDSLRPGVSDLFYALEQNALK